MGKFLGTYMQTCIIKILGNNFQQQWQHPITKKADAEPKKSRSNKKSRCRNSLLKNGPTKLPCLLILLASWVDFFDIGLLPYPLPHHTLQYCTRKSFWVTRTGESKLFCIGFSLFRSRCRNWGTRSAGEYFSKFKRSLKSARWAAEYFPNSSQEVKSKFKRNQALKCSGWIFFWRSTSLWFWTLFLNSWTFDLFEYIIFELLNSCFIELYTFK